MGQFDHVVVVGYGRSAVAKSGKKGALRNMHPVTMGGLTLKGVLERVPQLPADQIDDLIVGCAIPERKQGFNMARLVAARAGLPDSVCGMTINRFCSSGLQAIALAAGQIACGVADVMVAGGVESMTACPVNLDISDTFDPDLLRQREEEYMPMGLTAENVAARYGITRQEMDELALQSHRRAAAAQNAGKFDDEIIPLPGVDADGDPIVFDKDQGIRRSTTLEALAGLKPCFKEGGLVTAATSSQTSDAAAFVVLMRDSKAKELGIRPVAELLSFAVAGCEPDYMGLGPIYAAPKALADHSDYASHADLMWAGMLAHNNSCGIGRDQDWASHQIEHELSAFYDCAHGAGLAVVMPAWMEYVCGHDVMRFARFAVNVFGCEMDFAHPERTAQAGIRRLRDFFRTLGMPATLEEVGGRAEDIPAMVAHRCEKPNGFPFGGFVKIQEADMEAILRRCAN